MLEIVDAGKDAYRVERYAIEPLPRDAVVDGNINNLEKKKHRDRSGEARAQRLAYQPLKHVDMAVRRAP